VVELLRRQFVHVIVDLSRGFSELNITAIEAAHNLLVVCTSDRVGVRGVVESQRILRELLRLPGDPLQYVLNHPSPYAALSAEQLGEMLHIRPVISIPFGGDAPARAALEGQPLVTRFPNSPASKPIVSLATKLEQQLSEARAVASHASLPLKGYAQQI
jgi:pilus assembly protein CpaE